MSVSVVYSEALTCLGHGQVLYERLIAGESGLNRASEVFKDLPEPVLAGWVGAINNISENERVPQIFDEAFHKIVPDIVLEADLIVGGSSLGDLYGRDSGNPHAALTKAIVRHWPKTPPPVILASSACSSGTDAIIVATQAINSGMADIVAVFGFDSLESGKLIQHIALGTQSTDRARPFDIGRNGTSFAEACGVMLLASDEGLIKLKSPRLGSIVGFGMTSDSYDIAAPYPDGTFAANAIKIATRGIDLSHLGYINAHGSGTLLNDQAEANAFSLAFGKYAKYATIGGTKGALGHSLGATGVIETIVTLKALNNGIYPPTSGLLQPDPKIDVPILQCAQKRSSKHRYGLSTTLGFGGVNSAILIEAL